MENVILVQLDKTVCPLKKSLSFNGGCQLEFCLYYGNKTHKSNCFLQDAIGILQSPTKYSLLQSIPIGASLEGLSELGNQKMMMWKRFLNIDSYEYIGCKDCGCSGKKPACLNKTKCQIRQNIIKRFYSEPAAISTSPWLLADVWSLVNKFSDQELNDGGIGYLSSLRKYLKI